MPKITPEIRSLIIQKYLYMYSLSQISKEIGRSKTAVHNVVRDWNSRISFLDVDDIRIFLSQLRKSDITIEQCIQGYRTIQYLEQLGVDVLDKLHEWESENEDMKYDEDTGDRVLGKHNSGKPQTDFKRPNSNTLSHKLTKENNKSLIKSYQFSYFVEDIYNYCKKYKLKPSIIVRWIDDLFNFYSIRNNKSNDANIYENSNNDLNNTNAEEFQNSKLDLKYNDEIPFISLVSSFIREKIENIRNLENKRNSISSNIAILEKQKVEKILELDKVTDKEKNAYSYFEWYKNLSDSLFTNHGLFLEQEIDLFANALQDLKQYRFSATKILSEYKNLESIRQESKIIHDELEQIKQRKDNLLREITVLEDQSNYYRQTINIYQELHKEGLGLKELKQLNYVVMESAYANGLEVKDSIKNFLKDIEDQYDDKLGFEKKIKELKAEMENLKEQVPEYKTFLKLQGIVGPTLVHLRSCGVTDKDIIDMNHLVLEFKNTDFLSDPMNKNSYTSNTKTNDNISGNQYWSIFTEKLKHLKNINLELNKQKLNLNEIMLQLKDIERRKQEMEEQYRNSVSLLNYINLQVSSSIEVAKQINEIINKKMMTLSRLSPIFVYISIARNDEDDKGK